MGPERTRVAAITYEDGQPKILFKLTDNEEVVRNLSYREKVEASSRKIIMLARGMEMIRKQVLVDVRPDAKKLVIVIALGYGARFGHQMFVGPSAKKCAFEAKALRNSGSQIYVMLLRELDVIMSNNITGDPTRVHYLKPGHNFDSLMSEIKSH